jgi:hypothetical protein
MDFTLNQSMLTPSGAVSVGITATASAEVSLEEAFPLANDTLMNIAFPYATIKGYVLLADKACTIETNSANASGGQTITLAANVPQLWINGGDGANIFTVDVTKIYVSAAAAGTLKMRVLYDPTP